MKQHLVLALALTFAAACGKSSKTDKARDAATAAHAIDAAAAKPADGPYTMTVTGARALDAGKPVQLQLELLDAAGALVTKLAIVHEKPLHLIVVSKGLAEFAHLHPVPQPDGTLVVEHTFPQPGTYLLFGDFTPEGGKQTVARASVEVPGELPAVTDLVAGKLPATAKEAGYEVTLTTDAPLAVGETILKFRIQKDGQDVTDLQPYLGARGHCVILSADAEHYLHSHPLTDATADVQFHTELPAAGTYKLWAEFRPNGDPLRVSFVVGVADGAVATGDAPDAGMHDHHPPPAIDAGAAKPAPDAAPAPDVDAKPVETKISGAEQKAWDQAKPAFEKFCADCHTADGAKKSARKLAKFDMSTYPFQGKDASPANLRKVLGIGGGKATMPKGKAGSVQGDDLAAIAAWADAYDKAHP